MIIVCRPKCPQSGRLRPAAPAAQPSGPLADDEAKLARVTIIVAVAENGVVGRNNVLPWRLPEDLRRFKALTLGKPVIMGRLIHESMGRPLPGRRNIVLSRDAGYPAPGCETARSLDEALAKLSGEVMGDRRCRRLS